MGQRNPKTALVTGASGFIGGHLVDLLRENKYDVVCFVIKEDNLRWIEGKEVKIVYGDIRDKSSLYPVIEDSIQYVFHLAAVVKSPSLESYFSVNVSGTKNIVEVCMENSPRLKRFVYISSVAAMGPGDKTAIRKETDLCHPITEYGRSKLQTERFLMEHKGRLPFTILRPALVYGPRDFRGLSSYFKLISKGLKPILGEGFTNIIYVKDLVRCFLFAAETDEALYQTYVVGDEHVYSYREIADTISDLMEKKTIVLKIPLPLLYTAGAFLGAYSKMTHTLPLFDLRRARDIRYRYWMFDTSKAKKELGFIPKYTLEEGVKETIDWYKKEGWIK
jgi:nucleoside-diphosphate-sugar epimerase